MDHVRFGPAREAVLGVAPEPDQRLARGVAPFVDRRGDGATGERVRDSGELEDPADLVVEVDRARQRIRLGPALDRVDAPTALSEQDREHLSDRAVADDRDVDRTHANAAGKLR